MNEYTPKTRHVREYFVTRRQDLCIAAGGIPPTIAEAYAEFDRWIAEVIRAAKAEALKDLRDHLASMGVEPWNRLGPAIRATQSHIDHFGGSDDD